MSYVPPHRRIVEGESSNRAKPVVPPPSVQRQSNRQGNYRDRNLRPKVDIKYARNNVHKWFAVGRNGNPSNLLLEFTPFPGESYEHLRDATLYTLSANTRDEDDVENNLRSLAIDDIYPWKYICEKIKDDLKEAFHNVQSYMETSKPEYAKPTFVVRFGKILFHGGGISRQESVSSDTLENALKGERGPQSSLKKTFDTHVPKDIFEALRTVLFESLETPKLNEKDTYFIQVEDDLNREVILGLTCRKSSTDGKQLELKKIELDPVRHFVADLSCLNKLTDLRLVLITEKCLTDLSEEDREYIEGIVKSACIEKSAKGGLHWPLGDNVRNRFRVKGAWHLHETIIIGNSWNLKFKHANRAEFKASSGRVTYEVTLKLRSLTKYLRDQRPWEEENIMNMLEEILKRVWTERL